MPRPLHRALNALIAVTKLVMLSVCLVEKKDVKEYWQLFHFDNYFTHLDSFSFRCLISWP